jgi:hypothetical protein
MRAAEFAEAIFQIGDRKDRAAVTTRIGMERVSFVPIMRSTEASSAGANW